MCAVYIYIYIQRTYMIIYIYTNIFHFFLYKYIYIYHISAIYIYIYHISAIYIYIYHISIYHHEIMRTCFQSYRHVILPRWKKKQGGLWGTMNDSVNCNGKLQYAHHQKFKNSW